MGLKGCFGDEPKAGEGRHLDDLGRNICGKTEGKGDSEGWSHVYSWLVSMSAR